MKHATRTAGAFVLATSLLTAGTFVIAGPASAHVQTGNKTRSCGTTYHFRSEHNYAHTEKASNGSCSGHAWVRARQYNGTLLDWRHSNGLATVTGSDFQWTEHKTQENESAVRYTH
ncbi:hypothetical protein [Nonomuraea sp. NPDC050202]|jgi:hypothetical protein|uniref:hypothetical protein n=1 Tax=Nonomuraea sp. NPDC050202 TaxID=3155035 RepID=UPI00340CD5D2